MNALSKKERITLQILNDAGEEMYGLEIVIESKGILRLGFVYGYLKVLEKKDYVKSRQENVTPEEIGLPRRLYSINNSGRSALLQHVDYEKSTEDLIEAM